MKNEKFSKILTISIFVISLIALFIFALTLLIWLDVSIFGLQDPDFSDANRVIFYKRFTKMVIILGFIALLLTIQFIFRLLIPNTIKNKFISISIISLLEILLVASIITTIVFELKNDLITSTAFLVPAFYLTHLGIFIILFAGTYFFITALLKLLKKTTK